MTIFVNVTLRKKDVACVWSTDFNLLQRIVIFASNGSQLFLEIVLDFSFAFRPKNLVQLPKDKWVLFSFAVRHKECISKDKLPMYLFCVDSFVIFWIFNPLCDYLSFNFSLGRCTPPIFWFMISILLSIFLPAESICSTMFFHVCT